MKVKKREESQNAHNSKMIPYLPSEILLNILLRLPVRTIMICKCVCKSWLNLLVTPEFVKSHHSYSAPGLATFERKMHSKSYKIIEFINEVDLNSHEHPWNVVFDFDLPFDEPLYTSANGLLFHKRDKGPSDDIFISNPITREYIKLPSSRRPCRKECYGFGVSRMSGQYKVVRIFLDKQCKADRFECQVYTVGSGSWRRIASDDQHNYETNMAGAFLNGNIHWLANKGSSARVSCLDLETELFSTFSPPPPPPRGPRTTRVLSILGDCLCVCDTFVDVWPFLETDIWLIKEYGKEKSWTKEFVIVTVIFIGDCLGDLCPIKVFENGDILMELDNFRLKYYSCKTGTGRVIFLSGYDGHIASRATIYAPTFLPLKTFAMEDVSSF